MSTTSGSRWGSASRVALRAGTAIACAAVLVPINAGSAHALDFGSASSQRCTETAAARHGWGTPDRSDDMNSLANWHLYDGVGHAGNGRRTPDAVTISDGAMRIASDINGDSGGVTPRWGGRLHGRWEICARTSVAAPTWGAVALLWPDAEDWPSGGEIDFMEITDPLRQSVDYFLHYGAANNVEQHTVRTDATSWHSWAVEWTSEHVAVFLDGQQWAISTNRSTLPPRPMHLALQLDHAGGFTFPPGEFVIDRVAEYPI